MRKKNYKGRCEKRVLSKCDGICKTYDAIQFAYADKLDAEENVKEIKVNVVLNGLEEGEFTTDFLCVKEEGDYMVRECVNRKHLAKPMTIKLLDLSREYWMKRGIEDWGIVVNEEK